MTVAILVTGATGKQGGAVVNALIAQDGDVEILAVTRNTDSASAQKLAKKSPKIKLVQGDLDDPATVFANAKKATSLPVWGVYSVQVCWVLDPLTWEDTYRRIDRDTQGRCRT